MDKLAQRPIQSEFEHLVKEYPKDGASTGSLISLLQSVIIFMENIFFLMYKLSSLCLGARK